MFREYLQQIIQGQDLTSKQTADLMAAIFDGKAGHAQIGAFMGALATKGETVEELSGAAVAMRRRAGRIQTMDPVVVDTCGTGGDGSDTFNISTTAAFVVAGCGVTVAKHGNRSVSSRCGSADVLEALGLRLDTPPEMVEAAVADIGIGFLFAPLYHGAMRHAAAARREIGLRSIFNMLGPLTNPAGAGCQLIGVYAPALTEMFALALKHLGARSAWVVHGHDGMDEISTCAPTRVSALKNGVIKTCDLMPDQFFDPPADHQELAGGSPDVNARITRDILNGRPGPRRDIVVLNAAAALVVAGRAADIADGIAQARAAIDGGAALDKLERLVEFSINGG